MSTLNSKSMHNLCRKILMPVLFTSTISFGQTVNATDELGEWYNTILVQMKLRPQQLDNLLLAKQYSTNSNRPDIIQAIMMQESGANVNVKSNGNCHGILQIMTSTAMSYLKRNPDVAIRYFDTKHPSQKQVIHQLKTDVVFSIEIADLILASYLEKTTSTERVIYGYNRGDKHMLTVKNPKSHKYVSQIVARMSSMKSMNSPHLAELVPM